jgi:hypothetical protein
MWHQGESRIQAFSRAQQEAAESRRSQCSQKSDLTAPGNFLEGVEEFTASLRNPTTVQMPVRVPCLYLGAAFLAILAIRDRLIVENNAAETARNILAHERLFRIGIAGDLIYCAGVVVLLTALYVILRPVNRGLALLAAFWRLVWVLMWLVTTLNLFDALRLLSGADYLQVFEAERLQALARLYLGMRFDYYYVGCCLVRWHRRSAVSCGSSPVTFLERWLPSA